MPTLLRVARAPLCSSLPRPPLFSTRRVLPLLPRATLSLTLPLTPSIIPLTLMRTSLQRTISTRPLLTPYPTHCFCHPWAGLQQWLDLREPWE